MPILGIIIIVLIIILWFFIKEHQPNQHLGMKVWKKPRKQPHHQPIIFKRKPIVFSATFKAADTSQRLFELLDIAQHFVADYPTKGIGVYRGGNPTQFNELLIEFLRQNKNYNGPCILLLNCHGDEQGNLIDSILGIEISVTPSELLYGYGKNPTTDEKCFKGLDSIFNDLENTPAGPYYIVCGQCYGGVFADMLKSLIPSNLSQRINVIGLSYGPTISEIEFSSSNGKLGEDINVRHLDFLKWMKEVCGNAIQDQDKPVTTGVGVGSLTNISINTIEEFLRKKK